MYLALAATVLLTALALPAQNPDADRAVATFRQAVAQYKAMDFAAAKETFLKVDRDRLSKSDKASLDDYLSKIDLAIRRQAAAMMAYNAGVKALRANDAAKAGEQLEIAAGSEYLPEPVRRDARAQLALVAKTAPAAATTQPAASGVRLELPPPTTRPAGAEAAGPSQEPKAEKVLGGVLERRAKANVLLTEGKQALASGDSQTAATKFEQAVTLVPEMEEARELLQQARALGTEQAGPLTVLEQKRQIRRQQTDVEFDRALKHASELLLSANSAADFDAASESARLAENVLQANRNLYTVGEYRDKLAAVSKQLDGIQSRRSDWEQAQVQKQLDQMARSEADRTRRVKQQLDQQITTLTENAKTLREEQKYAESLEAVRQILRLQPSNSWAADQEAVLRQFIMLQEQKDIVRQRQTEEIRTMTDVQESAIPWYESIIFPRQWREQSQQREGKGIPQVGWDEDRRIRQVLREGMQTPLDIDVEKTLSEVLKQLEKAWGINIRVKWKYLDKVGYTEEGTMVSPMRLTKVTSEKVLRAILDDASDTNVGTPNELSYVIDSGEITISTRGDLARPITTPEVMQVRVYDTRDILRGWSWARTSFTAMGAVPTNTVGFTYASAGGSGGGGGASGSAVTATGTESNAEPNATYYERLRELIRNTIDPNSWGDPNVTDPNNAPGRIDFWNDQLVIRQTPANHAAIADLLNEIRQAKEIQVAIEAKFLSVSTSYLENINVDLDFVFQNLGSHWTGGTISFAQDPSFVKNISTGTNSIGAQFNNLAASTVTGSFLDDIQVSFLIRATQAHQDTRTLTAPRLTLMNGTRAAIWVGRTLVYVSEISWDVSYITSGTTTTPLYTPTITTATVNPGTALEIDATVSADLKYVTLRVRPSITQLLALNQVNIGGVNLDPNFPAFIQVPDLAQEWVDTTVTVPDGGTLLLGGLKSLGEIEKESGVPVLSKIPIINRGFTNRAKVKDDSTLLILIKPTIIVPRDDEKRLFP
jgi:general secretion pathway protein D